VGGGEVRAGNGGGEGRGRSGGGTHPCNLPMVDLRSERWEYASAAGPMLKPVLCYCLMHSPQPTVNFLQAASVALHRQSMRHVRCSVAARRCVGQSKQQQYSKHRNPDTTLRNRLIGLILSGF
jgi:hypothetical protein